MKFVVALFALFAAAHAGVLAPLAAPVATVPVVSQTLVNIPQSRVSYSEYVQPGVRTITPIVSQVVHQPVVAAAAPVLAAPAPVLAAPAAPVLAAPAAVTTYARTVAAAPVLAAPVGFTNHLVGAPFAAHIAVS